MRCLAIVVVLAGCGFQVSGGQTAVDDQPGDDQPPPPDTQTVIDAAIDAAIDAPPIDACVDDDGDGVCNVDDDWPCGPKPNAVGSPIAWMNTNGQGKTEVTQVSNTKLGGGNANLYVVAPNTSFNLVADYSIYDCICPGCIDQVQIGFATDATYTDAPKCLYSGTLSGNCMTAKTGNQTVSLKAPGSSGTVYDVVFGRAQANSCGGGWWPGMPAPNTTVAKVCVHN
ncbi:MAG TPA: hypothetical protein VGM90_16960 [Kofleriaceae bacterium]